MPQKKKSSLGRKPRCNVLNAKSKIKRKARLWAQKMANLSAVMAASTVELSKITIKEEPLDEEEISQTEGDVSLQNESINSLGPLSDSSTIEIKEERLDEADVPTPTETENIDRPSVGEVQRRARPVQSLVMGVATESHKSHKIKFSKTKAICTECNVRVCSECECEVMGMKTHFAKGTHSIMCDICGLVLQSECAYKAHKRLHIPESPFVCPDCGAVYKTSYGLACLQRHFVAKCHHLNKISSYTCTLCPRTFFRHLEELYEHSLNQHINVFFRCRKCVSFFAHSKLEAYQHIKNEHSNELENNLINKKPSCDFCQSDVLKDGSNHIRLMCPLIAREAVAFFMCGCSKTFKSIGALTAHSKQCELTSSIPDNWSHVFVPAIKKKTVPQPDDEVEEENEPSLAENKQLQPGEWINVGREIEISPVIEPEIATCELEYPDIPIEHQYFKMREAASALKQELHRQIMLYGKPFMQVTDGAKFIYRNPKHQELKSLLKVPTNTIKGDLKKSTIAQEPVRCPICRKSLYASSFSEVLAHMKKGHSSAILPIKISKSINSSLSEKINQPEVATDSERPTNITSSQSLLKAVDSRSEMPQSKQLNEEEIENSNAEPIAEPFGENEKDRTTKNPEPGNKKSPTKQTPEPDSGNEKSPTKQTLEPDSGHKKSPTKQTSEPDSGHKNSLNIPEPGRENKKSPTQNKSDESTPKYPRPRMRLFIPKKDKCDSKKIITSNDPISEKENSPIDVPSSNSVDKSVDPEVKDYEFWDKHYANLKRIEENARTKYKIKRGTVKGSVNINQDTEALVGYTSKRVVKKPKRWVEEDDSCTEESTKKVKIDDHPKHKQESISQKKDESDEGKGEDGNKRKKKKKAATEMYDSDPPSPPAKSGETAFFEKNFGSNLNPNKRRRKLSSKIVYYKKLNINDSSSYDDDEDDVVSSSGSVMKSKDGPHSLGLVCGVCKEEFLEKEEFSKHIVQHKSENFQFQCMECGECYVTQPTLVRHLTIIHGITDVPMQCNGSPTAAEAEMSEDVEENQCKVCREKFTSGPELTKHFRIHGVAFLKEAKKST